MKECVKQTIQYKWCRTTTGTKHSELSLAVFNTVLQLSNQPRANPKARHLHCKQCRPLSSARTRPKLQDQPGHRCHRPWCLERCACHSHTLDLPVGTDTYRGATDPKCLSVLLPIASDGGPVTAALVDTHFNAQRGHCPPEYSPKGGSFGPQGSEKCSLCRESQQQSSVRGCGRSVSAHFGVSGQRSHKDIEITHTCDGEAVMRINLIRQKGKDV